MSRPSLHNCPTKANAVDGSRISPLIPLIRIQILMFFFSHTPRNSPTLAVCPIIQLNFDTTYLDIDDHRLRFNLTRLLPTPDANHNFRLSPGFLPNRDRLAVPMTPSLDVINLLEQLTEHRNILLSRLPVYYKRV